MLNSSSHRRRAPRHPIGNRKWPILSLPDPRLQPATRSQTSKTFFDPPGALEPADRLRLIARLWASLPPEYWAAPTSDERAEHHGRIDPAAAGSLLDVPWRIVNVDLDRHTRVAGAKVYSAPRRFDLATIFVVTTAYCLLFALLSATTWPGVVSLVIAGFITLVGIGQARPLRRTAAAQGIDRWSASLLCWILARPLPLHVAMTAGGQPTAYSSACFSTSAIDYGTLSGGASCGYLAGTLVGGMFLIIDRVRQRFSRPPETQPVELPAAIAAAPASPEAS